MADEDSIDSWQELGQSCGVIGITLEEAIDLTIGEHFRKLNDERLGEEHDPTESDEASDEVIEDLDLVYKLLDTARQELLDEAHSGNLARRHHLESAVAAFEAIGTLFKAEDIVRQVLDLREHEEVPTED